jgi:hypothetical protein
MSLSWLLCVVTYRCLRWPYPSSRWVLPSVCVWVWVCASLSMIRCNNNPLRLMWIGTRDQIKKEHRKYVHFRPINSHYQLRPEANVSRSTSAPPGLYEASEWHILKQSWKTVAVEHLVSDHFNRPCVRQILAYYRLQLNPFLLTELLPWEFQTQCEYYYTKLPSDWITYFTEVYKSWNTAILLAISIFLKYSLNDAQLICSLSITLQSTPVILNNLYYTWS